MSGPDGRPALLILACSRRKSGQVLHGPAWDIYDGRVYQVLKKALRERPGWESEIEVLIVSARHGVIAARDSIETYEERLTTARASELASRSTHQLRRLLAGGTFRAAHANLGYDYRSAVPELAALLAPVPIDWPMGGIGSRNAQTRAWVLQRLSEAGIAAIGGETPRPRSSHQ
jgi:hypothetical protein